MRKVLFIFVILLSLCAKAQDVAEEAVYKYLIVTMENADKKGKIKVRVDDGVKNDKLKDDKENSVVFNTKAGILMYFTAKGWEFVDLYTSTQGGSYSGTGSTKTSGIWLFRKKTTKEELESIVEQAIRD